MLREQLIVRRAVVVDEQAGYPEEVMQRDYMHASREVSHPNGGMDRQR